MKNDLIPALKKELENSFGRKILSSRDCLQMVEDIYQKTGYTINANTLRRFFGLVKSAYNPSPSTLAIFSKYCGFNSIDELENISFSTNTDTTVNKEEIYHYLCSLFKNLPIQEGRNPAIEAIVQQTVIFLERNPSLIDRFQREIAATAAGQYYYFERFVNIDRLDDYYGNGLRYYTRSKNTSEALAFACSMQIFRYWLTNNPELMGKNMEVLSKISISSNCPSHIQARYLAAKLFYAHAKAEPSEKILTEASKYYFGIISKIENHNPDIDLIIGEALILTNHYAEGQEFIRRGKSRLSASKNTYYSENPLGKNFGQQRK